MDKKKGIILAVVIFLLIGLGTFVFANPSEESLNGNDNNSNNTNNTNDNENLDDENTNDGDGEEGEDENTPNDVAQNEDPTDVIIGGGDSQTNTSGEENGNGEESQPSNPADTSAPIVTILGKTYQGLGNTIGFVNTDVRLFVTEGNLTVEIVDEEGNSISFTDGMTLSNDGTYKISVSDASGNTTEVELSIDQSAPVISGILNGTITNTVGTITVDDVNEVTVLLNGSEVELDQIVNHLVQGVNTITATDSLGNESKISFTYDTEAIKVEWLYTLNATYHNTELADKHYKIIGDGQDLYVELVFTEEFESIPAITVGNGEAVNMSCSWTNWETERQYYKCDARIIINGEELGLSNGDVLPINISNIVDAAGNITTVTNTDITDNGTYGLVTYDKEAPKITALGITGFLGEAEYDAHYVTDGKGIRILIYTNEELEVEPTVEIGGKEFTATYRVDSSDPENDTYAYYLDIEDVAELELEEGIIQFRVFGYEDAAGNPGEEVTEEDTTYSENSYNQVIYDSVDPELEVEQLQEDGYVNTENTQINVSDTNPFITQVFDENEEVLNTRNSKQAEDGTYYDRFGIGWLGEGTFTVKVTDHAGNVKEETFTVDNTSASRVYSTVDFDGTGIDYVEENGQKVFYIKNDTSFVFRMQFSEELAENPILTINDTKKVTLELVEKFVTNEGKYIYQGTVEITADDKFEDGQLKLIVSNIKDLAGNETTDSVVTDQTVTSNNRTVVLDSKIDVLLFKTNSNNANDQTLAKAGDWVGVYLQVGEKLAQLPTFTINGQEIKVSEIEWNGTYTYQAGFTVTSDMDGRVSFNISNIVDQVGNNLALSSDECDYSVTIDNNAPTIVLAGTEGLNHNEFRIEAGTKISIDDILATVEDNVDEDTKIEPYDVTLFPVNGENVYHYDFKQNGFNTRLTGRYNLYYKTTDKAGNSAEAVMLLVINDTTPATLTFNREDGYTVDVGSNYEELGATVTDNVDETIVIMPRIYVKYDLAMNPLHETVSKIDTNEEGRYLAIFDYTDSSNNVSLTLKRWIVVRDISE